MDPAKPRMPSKQLQHLRSYYGDYIEESFHTDTRQRRVGSQKPKIKSPKNKKKKEEDTQSLATSTSNPFWVSISGFPTDYTCLVYRFFHDIGHVVDKRITDSNLMYIKYLAFSDCEVALSYDNQKIGYGGDIHVRVKPEKSVLENCPIDPSAAVPLMTTPCQPATSSSPPNGETSPLPNYYRPPICVIEMDVLKAKDTQRVSTQNPINPIVLPANSRKNLTFVQWLKQKVSYIFYFY